MNQPETCRHFKRSINGDPLCDNLRYPFTECDGTDCGHYLFQEKGEEDPTIPLKLGNSLLETHKIITGDRLDTYGDPEDCFQLIANYWNVYLEQIQLDLLKDVGADPNEYFLVPMLKAKDVAHLMVLFKMARIAGPGFKRDNYLDLQGYTAIAVDTLSNEDRKEPL